MAIVRPRLIASPEAAEPPETAAESPILTGSLDWARTEPGPATTRNRMSIRERRRMRILLGGHDPRGIRLSVVTGCSTTALARQRPPLGTTKYRRRKRRAKGDSSATRHHLISRRSTRATGRVAAAGGVRSGGVGPPRPARSPKGCESASG